MLIGTGLAALGRRHSVRRADHNDSWPARRRTVVWVLVLAVAAASCGASKHASTSPSLASPSSPADPGSRRLAMQQRPVLGIVYYGSPAWKRTALTCAPHDDTLMQCVAQTLESDRIVLVGSKSAGGRDKYILGPVVFDGSDVLRAVAVKEIGVQPLWVIDFRLTAEAARRFADATSEAIGKTTRHHRRWPGRQRSVRPGAHPERARRCHLCMRRGAGQGPGRTTQRRCLI